MDGSEKSSLNTTKTSAQSKQMSTPAVKMKKLGVKMAKKKDLNVSSLKSLSTPKNFSFLNTSVQKQTLRANNRALAQDLARSRQNLRDSNKKIQDLSSQNQALTLEVIRLRRVAGIRDEEIDGEVTRRMQGHAREITSNMEEVTDLLLKAGGAMTKLHDKFLSFCHQNNINSRGSRSSASERVESMQGVVFNGTSYVPPNPFPSSVDEVAMGTDAASDQGVANMSVIGEQSLLCDDLKLPEPEQMMEKRVNSKPLYSVSEKSEMTHRSGPARSAVFEPPQRVLIPGNRKQQLTSSSSNEINPFMPTFSLQRSPVSQENNMRNPDSVNSEHPSQPLVADSNKGDTAQFLSLSPNSLSPQQSEPSPPTSSRQSNSGQNDKSAISTNVAVVGEITVRKVSKKVAQKEKHEKNAGCITSCQTNQNQNFECSTSSNENCLKTKVKDGNVMAENPKDSCSSSSTASEKQPQRSKKRKGSGSANSGHDLNQDIQNDTKKDQQTDNVNAESDDQGSIRMRTLKPGVFTFSVSRKETDGSRKPVPEKVSKARSKKKKVASPEKSEPRLGEDRDMFNFGDRTPTVPLDKLVKANSTFDLSMNETVVEPRLGFNTFHKTMQKEAEVVAAKQADQNIEGQPDVPATVEGRIYYLPLKGSPDDSKSTRPRTRSKSRGRTTENSDDEIVYRKRSRSQGIPLDKLASEDSHVNKRGRSRSRRRKQDDESATESKDQPMTSESNSPSQQLVSADSRKSRGRSRSRRRKQDDETVSELEEQPMTSKSDSPSHQQVSNDSWKSRGRSRSRRRKQAEDSAAEPGEQLRTSKSISPAHQLVSGDSRKSRGRSRSRRRKQDEESASEQKQPMTSVTSSPSYQSTGDGSQKNNSRSKSQSRKQIVKSTTETENQFMAPTSGSPSHLVTDGQNSRGRSRSRRIKPSEDFTIDAEKSPCSSITGSPIHPPVLDDFSIKSRGRSKSRRKPIDDDTAATDSVSLESPVNCRGRSRSRKRKLCDSAAETAQGQRRMSRSRSRSSDLVTALACSMKKRARSKSRWRLDDESDERMEQKSKSSARPRRRITEKEGGPMEAANQVDETPGIVSKDEAVDETEEKFEKSNAVALVDQTPISSASTASRRGISKTTGKKRAAKSVDQTPTCSTEVISREDDVDKENKPLSHKESLKRQLSMSSHKPERSMDGVMSAKKEELNMQELEDMDGKRSRRHAGPVSYKEMSLNTKLRREDMQTQSSVTKVKAEKARLLIAGKMSKF